MSEKAQRRALVTGSRAGLGAAVCEALVADGWHIVGVDKDYPPGQSTSGPHLLVGLELGGLRSVLTSLEEACGPLKFDCVVCCAGTSGRSDTEDIGQVMSSNVVGVEQTIRFAQNRLNNSSTIVLVGAYAGIQPYLGHAKYSASKAALRSLAISLGQELGPRGVRVCNLVPGPMETPMQFEDDPWPYLLNPARVAEIVLWLCGLDASVLVEELRCRSALAEAWTDMPSFRYWPDSVTVR